MTDNRIYVKDYWNKDEIILAFSRQDEGLIAIGEKLIDGGEKFIHLNIKDIEKILKKRNEYLELVKEYELEGFRD